MTSLDFAPLFRTAIGFDRLAGQMDSGRVNRRGGGLSAVQHREDQ